MGVCFHRGRVLGNMVGRSFPYGFRGKGKIFFYRGNFCWRIRKTCKRNLWKRATISIGAPVGENGGGSFTGTFLVQMKEGSGNRASLIKLIWAPFIWIQIVSGAWFCGQSELLWRTRVPMTWHRSMGAKRPCIQAYVHWDRKGSNPVITFLYHTIQKPFKVSMHSVSLIKSQMCEATTNCGTGRQFV